MTAPRILGVGMTPFGKHPMATIRTLTSEAVREALADAGVDPSELGMAFFSNAAAGILSGQEMIRGQVCLGSSGIVGVPIVNVENACAGGSTAFYLACMAVRAGEVDVALVVGAEKLTHEDKRRSFEAIGTALDVLDLGPGHSEKHSPFVEIYAARAKAFMATSGATPADFAEISVKSRRHASLNPKAQFRTVVSVDDVLASRLVVDPLTLHMCSPIGDGAAALVVCSEEYAARRSRSSLAVRSCVLRSGSDRSVEDSPSAVVRATARAYEDAGLGPEDLDVVELHDAAASAELSLYEDLGLCGRGEAVSYLRTGSTALGGRLPVNPSGGLLSRGHPIGATGCAQLVELADQLWGRAGARQVPGARIALAENSGGRVRNDNAAATVTILSA